MRISVLINNYNYRRFIERAVLSALKQSPPPHEIVVVDDGSTDDSLDVIEALARANPTVRVVAKPNGGQLSAFNAGFAASSGDLVCFLDADDEFLPGYLARLLQVYSSQPAIDFVYCTMELVRDGTFLRKSSDAIESFDHGISFFRTLATGDWVGSPTSGISARRRLLHNILPCKLEASWRIRADDVLVIGAAMAPGRKLHLAETFVRYHVHGANAWFERPADASQGFRESLERRALAGYFGRHVVSSLMARQDWRRLVLTEFRTIPRPRAEDVKAYTSVIVRVPGSLGWIWKLKIMLHWLNISVLRRR